MTLTEHRHLYRSPAVRREPTALATEGQQYKMHELTDDTAIVMSKYHFFVYCPDKTEEGTLQRRLAARPTHLGNAKTAIESGFIRASIAPALRHI